MIKYISLLVTLGLVVLVPSPAEACATHAPRTTKGCANVVVDHHPIRPEAILCEWNFESNQHKRYIRRSGVMIHCVQCTTEEELRML